MIGDHPQIAGFLESTLGRVLQAGLWIAVEMTIVWSNVLPQISSADWSLRLLFWLVACCCTAVYMVRAIGRVRS